MFSQTAEYALRAAVALAQQADIPLTTAQIAEQTKVPAGYLSKVLQSMVREGLISAVRGLHGGYRLRREASELTILEVINSVDPIQRICSCPLDLPEHADQLCTLHRRLDQAIEQVENALGMTTLDELLEDTTASIPLCQCFSDDKKPSPQSVNVHTKRGAAK